MVGRSGLARRRSRRRPGGSTRPAGGRRTPRAPAATSWPGSFRQPSEGPRCGRVHAPPTRSVRRAPPDRLRWLRDGVARLRRAARLAGGDQGARRQLDRGPPDPAAVPRGGPLPAQGRVAARRLGLRRRRARRRAPLPGHVVRRPGHPRRPARRRGADDGPGDGGGPPGRRRAAGAARPRHPAPRHQAGQRAVPQHRRQRARCASHGRRPRPRQVARHVVAADDDRRHTDVRRAGAGARPSRRTPAPTSTPSPPWRSSYSRAGRRSRTSRCRTR